MRIPNSREKSKPDDLKDIEVEKEVAISADEVEQLKNEDTDSNHDSEDQVINPNHAEVVDALNIQTDTEAPCLETSLPAPVYASKCQHSPSVETQKEKDSIINQNPLNCGTIPMMDQSQQMWYITLLQQQVALLQVQINNQNYNGHGLRSPYLNAQAMTLAVNNIAQRSEQPASSSICKRQDPSMVYLVHDDQVEKKDETEVDVELSRKENTDKSLVKYESIGTNTSFREPEVLLL